METVLSIKDLSKIYGNKFAIKNVSFDLQKGNVYGLLGPNGSGKSTTLGIVLGIINPSSGSHEWFSQKPEHSHLKRVGAILENPNFYPYLTGLENLKIVADIKEIPYSKIEEKLKLVNLFERKNSRFSTYSLGMKQRLAIASAMLNDPEVLILDEPTNGLDPQGIHEIRELIKQIAESGTTILLASHLLDEVEKVCDHVIVLKNGEIIFTGQVKDDDNLGTLIINSSDLEALKAALEKLEYLSDIKVGKDEITAQMLSNINGDQIMKDLIKMDIYPSSLSIKKQSLEDKFLSITK